MLAWLKRKLCYLALVLLAAGAVSAASVANVSREDPFERIQAGEWVTASMYWEDKVVSTGKTFNPIGWHAAHKTLPIGTLIRVSNPKNHRSINITINDRGPFAPGRDLDLSLGAGTLLDFNGLGPLYMEVLAIPPVKDIRRPIVENLFTVSDANGDCPDVAGCYSTSLSASATMAEARRYAAAFTASGSSGSFTGALRLAERSSALVSIRLRCASSTVAAGVGRPSATRESQLTVSSAIGPRNSPSAMSPGG